MIKKRLHRPHTSFSADSLQKNCEFMIRYLIRLLLLLGTKQAADFCIDCLFQIRLPFEEKESTYVKLFVLRFRSPSQNIFCYPLDDVKIILLLAVHFLNDSAGKNEGSCWNFSKIRICSCKADSKDSIHSVRLL